MAGDGSVKSTIFGICITAMVLMVVFASGRLYTKAKMERGLRADDWLLAAAAIFALPLGILSVIATSFGAGEHNQNLNPIKVLHYLKISYAYEIIFVAACALPKLSLCVTYLFLFPSNANRIFCHCCMVFIICWAIASICEAAFQCRPIHAAWDPTIVDKYCVNTTAALISLAALNSLSDFAVYLWPARTLWRIQLPLRQRLGLVATFSAGCVVCVAGVLRIYYLKLLSTTTEGMYVGGIVGIIATVESNIGVFCCCLHGIRPLLAHLLPAVFKSTAKTYGSNSRPYGKDRSTAFKSLPDNVDDGKDHNSTSAFGTSSKSGAGAGAGADSDEDVELGQYLTKPQVVAKAWAAKGTPDGFVGPQNGITYSQSVVMESEDGFDGRGAGGRGLKADSGSEEYILKDAYEPKK
ncbi:hypothetical protein K432DRAFT_430883 [Lepidopterella palustris CBS 459.81]|uniref:Rhodopsin domain-containing protein n=1 Tax=Lepidopterella palustris CBS 459.81 TaxID=1314670 RepID=A0A8E2DW43_9PEZI|nr:hypothetical protein K432DRAFT_430883 [Lepidopterella palustris CBS 459.81]